MTNPSNPLVGEWGLRPRRVRRMSRSFAGVGVEIATARLRQIAAGAPFTNGESDQIEFALIATAIQRERRHAKFERGRRCCIRWLIVAGLVLVALNSLICTAYIIFSFIQQSSSY